MVAKDFENIIYNSSSCRRELTKFGKLLRDKPQLSERNDIQTFFKHNKQLSAFIGTFVPNIGPAPQLAFEFPFLGDFAADLILGNRDQGEFCVVEFEDGRTNSIFTKVRNKSTREWSRRFEHGYSQLVDWFYSLDDFKKTDRFKRDFGQGHIKFFGLLVIGRSAAMSEAERSRLRWRTEKTKVDSHSIECLTFDDLYDSLAMRMSFYPQASKLED